MFDSIKDFASQLSFSPEILDGSPVRPQRIVLSGMGGSHLSAGLYSIFDSSVSVHVHRSYGLPHLPAEMLQDSVMIASSYSGNTEETLDFLHTALSKGYRPAVITTGGKLLEIAEKERLMRVVLPKNVIQPRVAVGLSLVALSALTGNSELSEELIRISKTLEPLSLEGEGKHVAKELYGCVPLIYAASERRAVAYNWKIKINETAKIPAFFHDLPEVNHNEMAGFALGKKGPTAKFKAVFLLDGEDHPRIAVRANAFAELLSEHGIDSTTVSVTGETSLERALRSLLLADWVGYHLALHYGTNPDDNPIVEEFKKRIA